MWTLLKRWVEVMLGREEDDYGERLLAHLGLKR
jgi:hypothetical protein